MLSQYVHTYLFDHKFIVHEITEFIASKTGFFSIDTFSINPT